jgi:hypothetical protein
VPPLISDDLSFRRRSRPHAPPLAVLRSESSSPYVKASTSSESAAVLTMVNGDGELDQSDNEKFELNVNRFNLHAHTFSRGPALHRPRCASDGWPLRTVAEHRPHPWRAGCDDVGPLEAALGPWSLGGLLRRDAVPGSSSEQEDDDNSVSTEQEDDDSLTSLFLGGWSHS